VVVAAEFVVRALVATDAIAEPRGVVLRAVPPVAKA
jgi:hypothetical protein